MTTETWAMIWIPGAITALALFYLMLIEPEWSEIRWINHWLGDIGIPKSVSKLKMWGRQRTPQGAHYRSTQPVPEAFVALIDTGIQNQITRHNAAHPTWDKYKNVSDYDVVLIDPMGTTVENDPGAPLMYVRGISAAGTCIGVNPFDTSRPRPFWQIWRGQHRRPHIIACQQSQMQWSHPDFFMNTIWNESEHVRERENDVDVFMSYTGENDSHPHVP